MHRRVLANENKVCYTSIAIKDQIGAKRGDSIHMSKVVVKVSHSRPHPKDRELIMDVEL